MATAITSANTNNLGNARSVVRTSGGTLYAVVEDSSGTDAIEVWKSSDGTSWTEQDSGNKPTGADYSSPAVAIDSSDVLHIAWANTGNMVNDLAYQQFATSSDTWSGSVELFDALDDDRARTDVSIAVDSSDIPHVGAVVQSKNMATGWDTVVYQNRIGGSWNASSIEVEGVTAELNCTRSEILINGSNVPEIVYVNVTSGHLTAAQGNANDATSFTLHDVDTTSIDNEFPSIAIDSSGNTWVGYSRSGNVYLAEHQSGDGWTTWQTPITNSNAHGGTGVSIAIEGTDVYVFYEEENHDIAYDKYTGSWAGETVLETGTYNNVRAKWARYVDNDSGGTDRGGSSGRVEIDYLFVDETVSPDVLWGSLSLSNAQTATPSAVTVPLVTPAPTIAAGAITATPTAVAVPITLTVPTIASSNTIAPSALTIPLSIPAPTLVAGAVALAPDPVTVPLSVPVPALVIGAITASPDAVTIPILTAAPTLTASNTLAPDALTIPLAIPVPTLVAGAVALAPDALAVPLSLPAPTIAAGAITAAPTVVTVPITLGVPTAAFSTTLTPAAVTIPLSIPAPTLSSVATLTPDALTVPLSIPAPTVTLGALTATPDALTIPLSVPAPTIAAGAVTATPDVLAVAILTAAPTVTGGTVAATPTSVAVPLILTAPTIAAGAVALTPDPLAVTIAVPIPGVTLGGAPVTGEGWKQLGERPIYNHPWYTPAWWFTFP